MKVPMGSVAALALLSAGVWADWPTWRHDAGRSGATSEVLPPELSLHWRRELGPVRPAFPYESRLHFDTCREPILTADLVIVGSTEDGSTRAFSTATGEERRCFFTGGPVRGAPALWQDRVVVGSDDGCLCCLYV